MYSILTGLQPSQAGDFVTTIWDYSWSPVPSIYYIWLGFTYDKFCILQIIEIVKTVVSVWVLSTSKTTVTRIASDKPWSAGLDEDITVILLSSVVAKEGTGVYEYVFAHWDASPD